jgi:hypothetical protein
VEPTEEVVVEEEVEEVEAEETPAEAPKAEPAICAATTKAGNPCKGKAVADSDYCMAHGPK